MERKEELAQRLAFLGITAADMGRLQGLRPILADATDALVADLYRHLLSFPATRRLLLDREQRRLVLARQPAYLMSLAGARVDAAYVEERRRVGEALEAAGLSPAWLLGGYARFFSSLAYVIEDAVDGDVEEFRLVLVALLRRVLLDAQLTLEAHIERHDRRLEYLNEELARTLRDSDRDEPPG